MKTSVVFVVVGLVALFLGSFIAWPLYNNNIHTVENYPGGRADLGLNIVYAYFKLNPFSENTLGLWRSEKDLAQAKPNLVDYLIIMNVTNYSNKTVYMDSFQVDAAQNITSLNAPCEKSIGIFGSFLECTRITEGATDRLHEEYPTGTRWQPYQSRLVAFSGIAEVRNASLLETGTFYMGGIVYGTPIDGLSSEAVGSEMLNFTINDNEFIYNNLLGPNQTLRLDWEGQIAYVEEA